LIVFAIAEGKNLFETLETFLHEHEDWHADEIVFVLPLLSVALMIFGYRRIRELRIEVKARSIAEAESRRLARHDPLTGLPNRRFFSEKLDEALRGTLDQGIRLAILMLDLDGFKQINDVHGHAVGDQALMETAARIASVARGSTVRKIHPALIQPFMGYLWKSGDFFLHGFESVMVPTDSRDVTVFFSDIGVGYWVYRGGKESFLTGLTPTVGSCT